MIWLGRAVMIPTADEQGDGVCTSAEWRSGGRLRAAVRWVALTNKRPFMLQARAVAPQSARKAPGQSLVSRAGGILTAPRSPVAIALGFALLVALSIALHVQVMATSTGAAYDIQSYAIQAASVLRHQNVYDVTKRYPYPPVWIWIVTLMRLLASATQLPFNAVVKLPAMLGDVALVALLYRYGQRQYGSSARALLPAALFGLNPLTLLISAGHGQFDSLDLFFLLLAAYLRSASDSDSEEMRTARRNTSWRRQNQQPGAHLWSAVALGVAIALKGYPVLFMPYFVLSAPKRWRAVSALLMVAPLIASVIFYSLIFGYSAQMLPHMAQYPSTYDAGWGYLLRKLDPTVSRATLGVLSTIAKIILCLFSVAVPFVVARRAPVRATLLVFAVFYATTVAMGVQYTLWILPFLCLAAPWWVIPYTAAALAAIVPFYLRVFPGALPTGAGWSAVFAPFSAHRTLGVASVIAVALLLTLTQALLMGKARWQNQRSESSARRLHDADGDSASGGNWLAH